MPMSDKYADSPRAKIECEIGGYRFVAHCPNCNDECIYAQFLEETGYMIRTVVYRCGCGTIYHHTS